MRLHHVFPLIVALLTAISACQRSETLPGALAMEQPSVAELAEALNVRIWKFHPPIPPGAKHVTFVLQFARRGEAPKRIAELSGVADSKIPLVIALHTPTELTGLASSHAGVVLGQGGSATKTHMQNYFANNPILYIANDSSTPPHADSSGKIVLLAAGDGDKPVNPGSADNDLVLFLTVEPR